MGTETVAIVIAALNEADNIASVVERAMYFGNVIVVDDGSTDGTGAEASMAGADIITHLSPTHIKAAYRDGFESALRRGFDIVVQMDAGLSHYPAEILRLLAPLKAAEADMVIGSRFIPGSIMSGQTLGHRLLSRCGGMLIRATMGLDLTDSTSGFRAYRSSVLSSPGLLDSLQARAHAFQFELAYRVHQLGFRIGEVPITYVAGRSSVRLSVVVEALMTLRRLAWEHNLGGCR